jgi:RNA polymerase sigma factor (sigma-70 family)
MERLPPNSPEAGKTLSSPPDQEASVVLLERARTGDRAALERLCDRYLPRLRRWASGRLPAAARGLVDTNDLAQETLIRVLQRLEVSELRSSFAFNAYLRQALLNRILDEVRRAKRRPGAVEIADHHVDPGASPLEQAIGADTAERYEAALARLRPDEREAVVARIELGQSYEEVAEALGKPSADAARMAVSRALLRLAREMNRGAR